MPAGGTVMAAMAPHRTAFLAIAAGLLAWLAACTGQGPATVGAAKVLVLDVADPSDPDSLAASLRRRHAETDRLRALQLTAVRVAQDEDWMALARRLHPELRAHDLVVAYGMLAARAIQLRDPTVPVVFVGGADPVQLCMVDTLGRPGRRVTGFTRYLATEDERLVELLADAHPDIRRVVFLVDGATSRFPSSCDAADPAWGPREPGCATGEDLPAAELATLVEVDRVHRLAARRGLAVEFLMLCGKADFQRLAALARPGADTGFVVPGQQLFLDHDRGLVDALAALARPAVFGRASFLAAGASIAQTPDEDVDGNDVAAEMAMQILDGRDPARMPVQSPRGFRVSLSLREGQPGPRPSLSLLRRADEIRTEPSRGR